MTTPRDEADQVTILSGVENGKTLGTPIGLMVQNKDQRPGDYGEMGNVPRPSHADFTYQMKYGNRAASGGGRSSARETIGRVAAGAIAEKILEAIDSRGQVRDEASPKLTAIRATIERASTQMNVIFKRILRQPSLTKLLQYSNVTFHSNRKVLPLKAEHRGRIKGIIHRSSDSGAEH